MFHMEPLTTGHCITLCCIMFWSSLVEYDIYTGLYASCLYLCENVLFRIWAMYYVTYRLLCYAVVSVLLGKLVLMSFFLSQATFPKLRCSLVWNLGCGITDLFTHLYYLCSKALSLRYIHLHCCKYSLHRNQMYQEFTGPALIWTVMSWLVYGNLRSDLKCIPVNSMSIWKNK